MKKILMILIIAWGTLLYAGAPSLYPGVAEIELRGGRGQGSFLMFNTGELTKKYMITVRDVDNFGEESLLGKHLKVFPRFVEIEPGKNKKIRFLIRNFPQDSVEDGEHKASISIEELDSSLAEKHRTQKDAQGITTVINYRYHINMAVYGYVGELLSRAEVDLARDGDLLSGTIRNTGNYSYPVKALFFDAQGGLLQEAALPKLMMGEEQPLSFAPPAGSKKIQVRGGREDTLLYESPMGI